jgi:hypothetical protein
MSVGNNEPACLPEIVADHFAQFAWCCSQWRQSQKSGDVTVEIANLWRQPLASHLDGVLVAGQAARELLQEALGGEEDDAFAAGMVLLRHEGTASQQLVLSAIVESETPLREAIRDALCQTPLAQESHASLLEMLRADVPALSLTAACILAWHGVLKAPFSVIANFIVNDDPLLRSLAWRVAALVDHPEEA